MVPVVVIVPPVIGDVVATLLTEPLPAGVAQIPSPRQNVELEASVPPFRLVTGRLPVTPPRADDARLAAGTSDDTSARNVGATAPPVAGPANTVPAVCVDNVNDSAGVLVGALTLVVNSGERFPALKVVTVPPPPPPPGPISAQVLIAEQYLYCCAVRSQMVGSC